MSESGTEDAELLIGGKIHDNRFFEDVIAEYGSLRHVTIEDACVTASAQHAKDQLSFSARVEIAAGVVYSSSPPDPATGQESRDYRYVREVVSRNGNSPVGVTNRIPRELLAPIDLELDITRAATN